MIDKILRKRLIKKSKNVNKDIVRGVFLDGLFKEIRDYHKTYAEYETEAILMLDIVNHINSVVVDGCIDNNIIKEERKIPDESNI